MKKQTDKTTAARERETDQLPSPNSAWKPYPAKIPARNDKKIQSTAPAAAVAFPLPAPMDLAKLAATLGPADDSVSAMKLAMEFYIEAVHFLRECRWKGNSLIMSFGSKARKNAVEKLCREQAYKSLWGETLELHPSENDDPVRQCLAKQGIYLKKAATVLDRARQVWPQIDVFKGTRDNKPFYALPERLLMMVVIFSQQKHREAMQKHRRTKLSK